MDSTPASSPRFDLYDPELAPEPAGLNNTGAICWMNSFLQGFASCPAVVRAAFANRDYLGRTRTGRAIYDHIWAAVPRGRPAGGSPFAGTSPPLAASSAAVLAALCADLRERRPQSAAAFGSGQQSASEALVHVLEMIDDPHYPRTDSQGRRLPLPENPLSRLFYHRYLGRVFCCGCQTAATEQRADISVQFEYFHYDDLRPPPLSSEEFVGGLMQYSTKLEDYVCENCHRPTQARREYFLKMVPEIIVVIFNAYAQPRPVRYFPQTFVIPATGGGGLAYNQVAQIEHFGALAGGHYAARALRAAPPTPANSGTSVFSLNDSVVGPSVFAPAASVYMVLYHISGAPGHT